MSPVRWQQVKQIFDAAMSRAPSERVRLLDEACANDIALRREVETLLASHCKPPQISTSHKWRLPGFWLTNILSVSYCLETRVVFLRCTP